jgi:hypothetical protein
MPLLLELDEDDEDELAALWAARVAAAFLAAADRHSPPLAEPAGLRGSLGSNPATAVS